MLELFGFANFVQLWARSLPQCAKWHFYILEFI